MATKIAKERSDKHLFLSTDRVKKYDLFKHLLINLHQSLVLVGHAGVGKTTFLEKLQIDESDELQICYTLGDVKSSFEVIQSLLLKSLAKYTTATSEESLVSALGVIEQHNIKVVLLVDDADKLVPGVINDLCAFAAANSALQIVFTLTPARLETVGEANVLINECHFIEIPTLSRWECAKFLQNLSANPVNGIDIKHLTPGWIDNVFAESAGIPGKVLSFVSIDSIDSKRKSKLSDKFVIFICIGLLVGVVSYTMLIGLPEAVIKNEKRALAQETSQLKINKFSETFSRTDTSKIDLVQENTSIKQSENVRNLQGGVIVNANQIAMQKTNPIIPASKSEVDFGVTSFRQPDLTGNTIHRVTPSPNKLLEVNSENRLDNGFDDRDWILSQPNSNYTLQLIVLSNVDKAIAIKQEYDSLEFPIRLLVAQKRGHKRFVLLMGSFVDTIEAKRVSKTLPHPFQQSWLRTFGSIKRDL